MAPKQDPKPKFQEGWYRKITRLSLGLRLEGGGFVVVEAAALAR